MRGRAARALASVACAIALVAPGARAQSADAPAEGAPKRVITPPKLVKFVEAEFPPSEKAAQRSAAVVLQIAIKEDGSVAQVAVAESAGPAFDAAATAAAKQFVFEPAKVDGKPIPVKIAYRYEFTWKPEVVVKTTADFVGTVRDRKTKKPIAGVKVALGSGQSAVTDDQGRFTFKDLPPGAVPVTLSGDKLTTIATEETLEAGKQLDATYEVEPKEAKAPGEEEDDLEIVVTAPRLDKQVVSTQVAAEQGRKVPGTQGDVLKVVENMPGVARAAAGSGSLVVWGAAPQDTRVYVDGLRIPRLYHDGGYRSVIHSDLVRNVELLPGGYGPTYGRGLGGVVTVQMRPLDEDGFHGSVGADTIDAAASVRDKIGDRTHVAVAARKSYLDSVLNAFTTEDVGDVVPLPRYYDAQARVAYDLGDHETIEIGGLLSSDTTDRTLADPDPALTKRQTTELDFGRVYARYEKHTKDGATIAIVPSWGKDFSTLVSRFGGTPTELRDDSDVYGVRASWRGALAKWVTATVGVDLDVTSSKIHRAGSIGAPPREGDVYVFGQPPAEQINEDDWKTVVASVAPYMEADFAAWGDKLHVVPGARFEPYVTTTSRLVPQVGDSPSLGYQHEDTAFEPRVSVRYAATPRILVKAAFGIYHQPPSGEDLSAVFGTPKLGLSQAEHYLTGAAFQLTDTLQVEATAFLSESQDLVSRSTAPTPLLANALVQEGIGRSYGTQFLLRQQQLGRFFGWVSYSILRSERKDHPGLDWRLFDYDQSHVFTALGSYDLGLGFELGARFRYATGYPRTPVIGSYFDSASNAYEPLFGAHNSIRIPPFYALDVRLAKHFKVGKTEGEVYLDVQNVTNHANPEEIVYDPTYTQRGYITGLPVLPVVGARWSW
jgi:TonB family protein